jgi:hypothetical protein
MCGDRLVEVDVIFLDALPFQPSGFFVSATCPKAEGGKGVVVRGFKVEGVKDGGSFFVGEGLDLVSGFLREVFGVAGEGVGLRSVGSDGPVIATDATLYKPTIDFGGVVFFQPIDDVLGASAVDRDSL